MNVMIHYFLLHKWSKNIALLNECTQVQKPLLQRCYFERIHLSINKIQTIIIEQSVGVLSSSACQLVIGFVLHDFSATKTFFKSRHNCLLERLTLFPAMGSKRSEMKHSPRLRGNRQTDRQTDTLRLL